MTPAGEVVLQSETPSTGNSVSRIFCLPDILSIGKLLQSEIPSPELFRQTDFLIQNFSYERNLGRLGRGPTDAIHEAATLDAVPDIVTSYQPLLEGNLDPLAFDVVKFQGSLNSTIGLRR